MRKRQRRQRKRQNHGSSLSPDHTEVTVVAVADISTHRRQKQYCDLIRESKNSQQRRRIGELIDEPKLCGGLHPGANQRNQLTGNKQLEIPVLQCAKALRHEWTALPPRDSNG